MESKEGNETVTNCNRLKLQAADGKMRLTDVANTKEKSAEEKIKERMNPMMKKLTLALAMICVLSSVGTAFAADYLGNPRSMKFHYTTCRTIKHPENFVPIESRDEALAEGYVPCGVCKP